MNIKQHYKKINKGVNYHVSPQHNSYYINAPVQLKKILWKYILTTPLHRLYCGVRLAGWTHNQEARGSDPCSCQDEIGIS